MKVVAYEDVPTLCDELLDEIETTGVTIQVVKNGRAIARLEPIDEATRVLFATKRTRTGKL
jgi:antitoxin (DNA-binding transcriptional repressor) of toxin-antitoxin stability system